MFMRETHTAPNAPREQYYNDSLLTKPTTSQSVYTNLSAGLITPAVWAGDIQQMFMQRPEGNPLRNLVESVDLLNETPGIGWGKQLAGSLSNMIGYGLNPITWGFGRLGTLAAERTIGAVSKALPETATIMARRPIAEMLGENIGKYVPTVKKGAEQVPLSMAILGEKYAKAFGTFAGAGAPAAWYENYNADTNHINWGGVARDMGVMGVFGLAIESVPFVYGVVKSKINRGLGKNVSEALKPVDYDLALENGLINRAEYDWIKDYSTNPLEAKNLKERATQILADGDHPINTATHEVPVEIVPQKDIENLKSALLDQGLSDLPEGHRNSLSDYIIHNSIDSLRENPNMLDGLRGFKDHIQTKLLAKTQKLAQANEMVDKNLLKSVKENMPFSQKSMFKHLRQAGFETSHVRQIPITIPENIRQIMRRQDEISRHLKKIKQYEKMVSQGKKGLGGKISSNKKQIEVIESKIPKILTPKEELTHLKEKLLTEKGLPKNWESSKDYHRLLDLSHAWHNAKTLLDRVHLEAQYERQEAYHNLADQILKMTDSDISRFANRGNVVNYMRDRITDKIFKRTPLLESELSAEKQNEIPSNADEVMSENDIQVKNSGADKLSKEFESTSNRFTEFKANEGIFNNLIKCVLGTVNG